MRHLCKHPDPQRSDEDCLPWAPPLEFLPGKFEGWASQERGVYGEVGAVKRRKLVTYREDSKPERTFAYSEGFAVMERAGACLNISVHVSICLSVCCEIHI